jgi:hypothetical protein
MSAPHHPQLASSSPEEGLDFAACLLCGGIQAQVAQQPDQGAQLAMSLAKYVQFRYASELGLAWDELVALGDSCKSDGFRKEQFWLQLQLVGDQLGMPELDFAGRAGG